MRHLNVYVNQPDDFFFTVPVFLSFVFIFVVLLWFSELACYSPLLSFSSLIHFKICLFSHSREPYFVRGIRCLGHIMLNAELEWDPVVDLDPEIVFCLTIWSHLPLSFHLFLCVLLCMPLLIALWLILSSRFAYLLFALVILVVAHLLFYDCFCCICFMIASAASALWLLLLHLLYGCFCYICLFALWLLLLRLLFFAETIFVTTATLVQTMWSTQKPYYNPNNHNRVEVARVWATMSSSNSPNSPSSPNSPDSP